MFEIELSDRTEYIVKIMFLSIKLYTYANLNGLK